MDLPSTKPYMVRAIHEWCCDNGFTPHITVQVDEFVRVPRAFVRDDQITLNIDYAATAHLQIVNDSIFFQASFAGKAFDIYVPMGNVTAIYAKENGAGMAFPPETGGANQHNFELENASDDEPKPPTPPTGRPKLQRIK